MVDFFNEVCKIFLGLISSEFHCRCEDCTNFKFILDQSEVTLDLFKGIELVLLSQSIHVLFNQLHHLIIVVRKDAFKGIMMWKVISDAELFKRSELRVCDCYDMIAQGVSMDKDLSNVGTLFVDSL
jgi:hypothetical protein